MKNWAVGLDQAGFMEFVPFQRGGLERIAPGLTPELASQSLTFVSKDGRRFHGARAVFETMRRLPGTWGALGAILSFPPLSLLSEPFYRLLARHRGTISQKLGYDHCEFPVPEP